MQSNPILQAQTVRAVNNRHNCWARTDKPRNLLKYIRVGCGATGVANRHSLEHHSRLCNCPWISINQANKSNSFSGALRCGALHSVLQSSEISLPAREIVLVTHKISFFVYIKVILTTYI